MENKQSRAMWVLATTNLQTVKNKKKSCWIWKKNTVSTGTSPSCGFEEQQITRNDSPCWVHGHSPGVRGLGLLAAPELGAFGAEQNMSHKCTWELISLRIIGNYCSWFPGSLMGSLQGKGGDQSSVISTQAGYRELQVGLWEFIGLENPLWSYLKFLDLIEDKAESTSLSFNTTLQTQGHNNAHRIMLLMFQ